MTTFNIWKLAPEQLSPTGPWQFQSAILAPDRHAALETAKARHGQEGEYRICAWSL